YTDANGVKQQINKQEVKEVSEIPKLIIKNRLVAFFLHASNRPIKHNIPYSHRAGGTQAFLMADGQKVVASTPKNHQKRT
ncbi:hypothetical protein CJ307_33025, partial [Klebsiella quasipneumoniae]